MKYMTSDQIRDTWLKFFKSKGHFIEPSASLIPHNDPTLLWINSGVAALKKYFDGTEQPPHRRITNAQKAIRTNDIENVGRTARHHTFFEMLGNFSIGDYFRSEVIPWAVELLTGEENFGFPVEKLYITYHPSDLASKELWMKCGIPEDHLVPLESNFWEVGPGPSGPDTEIYFDRGEKYDPEHRGIVMLQNDEDNDRYIEIWNIVFSQYNAEPGVKPRSQYKELPQKNIDTGAGLERFACVIQGTETNFETDLFMPYIKYLEGFASYAYEGKYKYSYKVIADHIRTLTFALADGALFSNEGRGYVLRRLVRRLILQAKHLNIDTKNLPGLVDEVCKNMEHYYPYLQEQKDRVKKMITSEIDKFNTVIASGEKRVKDELAKCDKVLPGEVAFMLSDTYGIPFDLTKEYAEDEGKTVDEKGYKEALERQKEKARLARGDRKSFGKQSQDLINFLTPSTFTYEEVPELKAKVIGTFIDGNKVDEITENGEVIFDQTTFYAESGGQVADTGVITSDSAEANVLDVTKANHKQFLHHVELAYGSIKVGDEFTLKPDYARRHLIMRNHSATHILQKALQELLGDAVHQEGSYVNDNELRFDFSYDGKLSFEELRIVERRVNEIILKGIPEKTNIMNKEEALKLGAMALFNEKYDDVVRVVTFGDYSKEFCGGTHVSNTADILNFAIASYETIAAGVKRIVAYTGFKAYEFRSIEEDKLNEIASLLKVNSRKEITDKLKSQIAANDEFRKNQAVLESKIAGLYTSVIKADRKEINGRKVVAKCFDDLTHNQMMEIAKNIIAEPSNAILLISKRQGKSEFCVALSSDLTKVIRAGDIVKEVAKVLGGSGGGRPDLAFGGFEESDNITEAFNLFEDKLK